jgi:cytidylate kinase
MVIAIDGLAASGKSSTARAVAAALGFRHIDSGSLYRAVTAARARRPGDPATWTEGELVEVARRVTLEPVEGGFAPRLDGAEIEAELRSSTVTAAVSGVARFAAVRAWVNERMREAAARHDVVVDGRDIGSTVFPEAALKIFLDADPRERARRRLLQRGGPPPDATAIAAEAAELVERDQRDAAQSVPAPDAVHIDTTSMLQQAQVDEIVARARALLGA